MPPFATQGTPPQVPKGSIILIEFPFTDLSGEKKRPALVLYEGYLDVTAACITSQVPSKLLSSDLLVPLGTPSSQKAGLKRDSVILIDKIVTLEKDFILGILGEADDDLKREVNTKISQCLMFNDVLAG